MPNENEIRNSISSIYNQLLNKRQKEKEAKLEAVSEQDEEVVEYKEEDKVIKMSKKERRQAEIDNWKSVISDLVGDDFVFEEKKEKKKKYKKWIDDEDDNKVIEVKQKKKKKRNYQKEFDPELNILRTLLSDQNKFNNDLQKRFYNAMGPANKDAMVPNKTMTELASAIINGRNNSLGILKEMGSVKKTVADLYMKQKKLMYDLNKDGGSSYNDSNDLMLMGSRLMSDMDKIMSPQASMNMSQTAMPSQQPVSNPNPVVYQNNTYGYEPVENATPSMPSFNNIPEFDPSTWNSGPSLPDQQVLFENIPKSVVVEKNSQTGDLRFKAIRNDNGEEIKGYPGLPTVDPRTLKINEKDNIVKGVFDETYKLQVV